MIKRWRMALKYNNMVEDAEGRWVAWEDHMKVLADKDQRIADLAEVIAKMGRKLIDLQEWEESVRQMGMDE